MWTLLQRWASVVSPLAGVRRRAPAASHDRKAITTSARRRAMVGHWCVHTEVGGTAAAQADRFGRRDAIVPTTKCELGKKFIVINGERVESCFAMDRHGSEHQPMELQ